MFIDLFFFFNFPRRVEKSIKERVTAGGEHGDHVEGEEEEVVVGPAHQRYLQQTQCGAEGEAVRLTSRSSRMLRILTGSQPIMKTRSISSKMAFVYLKSEGDKLRKCF